MNRPRTTTINPNGTPSDEPGPLRFVFFGESIVSDRGYPPATTARAVMRALVRDGHEALFLEERRNRPTVELLRARGSSALRAFSERYPDLNYRTYDLPTGLERTVWFVRQIATVDAGIFLDDVPSGLFEEAARLNARHLVLVDWSAKGPDSDLAWADLRLRPAGTGAGSGTITCGPAVERMPPDTDDARSGLLLVAYDDQETAAAAREALAEFDPECLSTGSVSGEDWPFVPEVELSDRYRRASVAVVTGAGDDPFAAARVLLPVAAGCQTVAVSPPSAAVVVPEPPVLRASLADLPERVASLLCSSATAPWVELPDRYDAAVAARRMVEAVRQTHLVRLAGAPPR
ncbi:MAG: hypothetical protein QOF01_3927 [Thermomicrobiales bacterium]|jgi:hypothetical protein|nr:hypothetical protein [Thermomicrobiales bacterium]